jgi:hypothetical protein
VGETASPTGRFILGDPPERPITDVSASEPVASASTSSRAYLPGPFAKKATSLSALIPRHGSTPASRADSQARPAQLET